MVAHSHSPEVHCDCCHHGLEATLRHEQEMMQKNGWYAHIVADEPSLPLGFNYHTHGFPESFQSPDIQIILPLDQRVVHGVARIIAQRLREGRKFKLGEREGDLLGGGFDVMFVEAVESDRPVWRVILPDGKNQLERDKMHPDFAAQWHGL